MKLDFSTESRHFIYIYIFFAFPSMLFLYQSRAPILLWFGILQPFLWKNLPLRLFSGAFGLYSSLLLSLLAVVLGNSWFPFAFSGARRSWSKQVKLYMRQQYSGYWSLLLFDFFKHKLLVFFFRNYKKHKYSGKLKCNLEIMVLAS